MALPHLSNVQIRMYGLLNQLLQFPHICNRVEVMWGTIDCRKYLYGLAVDDFARDPRPNRHGFPLETLSVIMDLLELHDMFYPRFGTIFKSWEQSTF